MECIKDSIFDEMFFKHGWNKKQEISFWNKNIVFRITASAYTGQGIDDIQRKNYKNFIDNIEDISKESLQAVRGYIHSNKEEIQQYLPKEISIENIVEIVFPKAVIFKKDDSYGILCDCVWDPEHGLVIELPNFEVGPQDVFI